MLRSTLPALLLLGFPPALAQPPEPLPATLSAEVARKSAEAAGRLLRMADCQFLLQVLDPKSPGTGQLGFCLYPLTLERGIFVKITCVGVLVEPDSGTRHPFYGSKGHWGVEGKCDRQELARKIAAAEIDETVNPITDLREKQKAGRLVRLLRDELGLWETFKGRIAIRAQ